MATSFEIGQAFREKNCKKQGGKRELYSRHSLPVENKSLSAGRPAVSGLSLVTLEGHAILCPLPRPLSAFAASARSTR
jgi:hypothetical protein